MPSAGKARFMPSECPSTARAPGPTGPVTVPGGTPAGKRPFRLRGVWLLVPSAAILLAACWLEPWGDGHGTHRQLGLPACSFLVRTGYPCPTCGLTTAMALMARGRVAGAFEAHPFGVALFAAVVVLAGVGAGELATGRDVLGRLRPSLWWCALGIGALLAGWGWKLLTGLLSGTLPMR